MATFLTVEPSELVLEGDEASAKIKNVSQVLLSIYLNHPFSGSVHFGLDGGLATESVDPPGTAVILGPGQEATLVVRRSSAISSVW